ncbi:MAG: S8 family serine peptidase [Acidimicrobiia bacterium]|nr:S8 family serine peptidase [Acidimicrobiia bacterium]
MRSRSKLFRVLVVFALLGGLSVVTAAAGSAQSEGVQVDRAGRGYYVVQLDGPITDDDAAALRAAGAELLAYVPDFAYGVRMTAVAFDAVSDVAGVTAVTAVGTEDKLADDLAAEGLYRLRLQRGADTAAVAADVAAAGVEVFAANGGVLLVAGALAALDEVAGLAEVAWVENFSFPETHNEYGAGAISGGTLANAAGYDGSTQIVAVADTGIGGGTKATAHIDIPSSRIIAVEDWPGIDAPDCWIAQPDGPHDVDSGHGTHVAVSAVGDGRPSGVGTGTAPAADLVFQAIEDYADFIDTCAIFNPDGYYLIGLPADLTPLFQEAYDHGARVHSNSWGSPVDGNYTADSVTVDSFMWDNRDMLITYSAGNAGVDDNANGVIDDDSIGSPATAKNTLTVGASENDRQGDWSCAEVADDDGECTGGQQEIFTYGDAFGYPAPPISTDPAAGDAEQMAAFSSRGPTDDGRIKPDVVAPGTFILSGFSDLYQFGWDPAPNPQIGFFQYEGWGTPYSQYYKYLGGTSMSNPITAGGAAVVRDFYEKEHGHEPTAALTKATLINSAVDLLDENNDGVDDNDFPIPNVHEGWGRIDVAGATDGGAAWTDVDDGLSTGASDVFNHTVAGDSPLRVTVVWTDSPSTESASTNLVNDLDVTVTSPTGTVYQGNVFSGGWSTTGGNADRINNVENVYVESPAAGQWTVTVSGFNVPFGPQPFAVVIDSVPDSNLNLCNGLAATITGTSGDNMITGTGGADVIVGLDGNDTIEGLGGGDVICGGTGDDVLKGNQGIDTVVGGLGADTMLGGNGRDTVDGEAGADTLQGGRGPDTVLGGLGNDILQGKAGADHLLGGSGDDALYGGVGVDVCDGGAGTDTGNVACETKLGIP